MSTTKQKEQVIVLEQTEEIAPHPVAPQRDVLSADNIALQAAIITTEERQKAPAEPDDTTLRDWVRKKMNLFGMSGLFDERLKKAKACGPNKTFCLAVCSGNKKSPCFPVQYTSEVYGE